MMIGIPRYNHAECVAYLVDKLQTNGFYIKYTHPNLLLISWKHWIPGYVRTEIKNKMNVSIDGYGNVIQEKSKIDEAPKLMLSGGANMSTSATSDTSSTVDKKKIGIYSLDLFKNLKE